MQGYKLRAEIMKDSANHKDALRNYMNVLRFIDEDGNEETYKEVIIKICSLAYTSKGSLLNE